MNDNSQFAMSHGSYDSNLGSKKLILAGDIRSRSWPKGLLFYVGAKGR